MPQSRTTWAPSATNLRAVARPIVITYRPKADAGWLAHPPPRAARPVRNAAGGEHHRPFVGQVALARHADSSSGEILHLRAMIDVTDTARAYLHREDDPKLCLAAHHPRVGLCCFYERILLDHRPDTGQLGEAQRIFRVGRRS